MPAKSCDLDPKEIRKTMSCITFNIRQVERALTRVFDTHLMEFDITSHQFTTMAMLGIKPGQSMHELSDRLGIELSSFSRNLKVLEKNGWVSTEKNPLDGRQRLVSLSDAGCSLLAELLPVWEELNGQLEALLDMPLGKLLGNLRKLSDASPESIAVRE